MLHWLIISDVDAAQATGSAASHRCLSNHHMAFVKSHTCLCMLLSISGRSQHGLLTLATTKQSSYISGLKLLPVRSCMGRALGTRLSIEIFFQNCLVAAACCYHHQHLELLPALVAVLPYACSWLLLPVHYDQLAVVHCCPGLQLCCCALLLPGSCCCQLLQHQQQPELLCTAALASRKLYCGTTGRQRHHSVTDNQFHTPDNQQGHA